MNNIFLVPNGRSVEYTRSNFGSILIGKSYNSIEPFLNQKEREVLSKYELLKVWGVVEWHWSAWSRMQPGDFILFYEAGNFCFSAKVIATKHSEELAKQFHWSSEVYPYLFFVDNLKEVNIPMKVINQLAGFEPNYYLGTFTPLYNDKVYNHKGRLNAIRERFGSIENFLAQYTLPLKPKELPHNPLVKMYYLLHNYFGTKWFR